MLAPDFSGNRDYLTQVFETEPEVFAHNVETVPRIFKSIRPGFRYDRSLDVLRASRDFGLVTKSNLILGMGETRAEVSALVDLYQAGAEIITITQYLALPAAPSGKSLGTPRGVPRAAGRGRTDRLRGSHERSAGPFLLPGGPALPSGDGAPQR